MMRILLLISVILANGMALAFDEDCGDPNSGSTRVSACLLSRKTDEMDKELNAKYREVLKMYQRNHETKEAKLLIEAQRAWIRYRDKVCEFEDQAFGGISSISWARCTARITETRLNELKKLAGE